MDKRADKRIINKTQPHFYENKTNKCKRRHWHLVTIEVSSLLHVPVTYCGHSYGGVLEGYVTKNTETSLPIQNIKF